MDFASRMELLSEQLRKPLPGLAAQMLMAPPGRIPPDYDPCPPGARESAVLLIFAPGPDLVFIRRAEDGRRHSGQIAFPGGIREPQDADLEATALRETEEEIGARPEIVTLLGALTPLYIPVSGITVQPFVAACDRLPEFAPHPGEVDEVIVIPVDDLQAAPGEKTIVRDGADFRVPCFRIGGVEIWGATAMITAELLQVWQSAAGTK